MATRFVWDRHTRRSFESALRASNHTMRSRCDRGWYVIEFDVGVPTVGTRHVTIVFSRNDDVPLVFADGPTESPHRYGNGALCLWYPHDPPKHRWERRDGLVALVGLITRHLFFEDWWRHTGGQAGGEWLGDEAPHGDEDASS